MNEFRGGFQLSKGVLPRKKCVHMEISHRKVSFSSAYCHLLFKKNPRKWFKKYAYVIKCFPRSRYPREAVIFPSLSNWVHAPARMPDLNDITFVYSRIHLKRKTPHDIRGKLYQLPRAILNHTRY